MNSMTPAPITSPAWSGRTKRTIALIGVFLLGLALWRMNEILPIVSVSVILAFLLTPSVNFVERYVLALPGPVRRRPIAILITFSLLIMSIIIVILVVVPVLVDQFQEFASRIPELLRSLENTMEGLLSEPLRLPNGDPILLNGNPLIPLEQLRGAVGVQDSNDVIQLQNLNLVDAIQSFIASLTGPAFSFVGGALTALINLVFLMTMAFYLIKDGAGFIGKLIEITPRTYRGDLRRLLYELAIVWNSYLRGQLTLSLTMGTLVTISATLLGVPNAAILGLISGLLEFIPTLGPALALFPAILLSLFSQSSTLPFLEGPAFALVVFIVWSLLQNIEALVLVPRVMGGNLNLHPFVILVAVIAGTNLAGALGVILAAPTVASLRVLGQYLYGKLTDQNPFPAVSRPPPRPSPQYAQKVIRHARAWAEPRIPGWRMRTAELLARVPWVTQRYKRIRERVQRQRSNRELTHDDV